MPPYGSLRYECGIQFPSVHMWLSLIVSRPLCANEALFHCVNRIRHAFSYARGTSDSGEPMKTWHDSQQWMNTVCSFRCHGVVFAVDVLNVLLTENWTISSLCELSYWRISSLNVMLSKLHACWQLSVSNEDNIAWSITALRYHHLWSIYIVTQKTDICCFDITLTNVNRLTKFFFLPEDASYVQ